MQPQPTGRLVRKDDGVYIVIDRIFKAPIEEVWTYFSRSPRLAEWIGEYKGTGSTGAVKFRMNAEGDDAEWQDVAVRECTAPHRLHVVVDPSGEAMVMYVHLTEASGHTTVTFGYRLHKVADGADLAVGWDYYFDRLTAAHDHKPMPEWSDYHPAMVDHYATLCHELDHDLRSEQLAQRNGTTG